MCKKFFGHVLPTMLAYALSGIYTVVDGYFVGQTIGDVGLAAINLAFPMVALLQAIGTGVGMGGAILFSINREKAKDQATGFFHATIWLLLSIGVVVTILMFGLAPIFLRFLGAKNQLFVLALSYTRCVAAGALFQILATGLVPLIRNLNGSLVAMSAMIVGFSTNILLDSIFVPRYGMMGAAAATVIGQLITAIICLGYLNSRRLCQKLTPFRALKSQSFQLLKVGISPFGQAFSPNIILIMMNSFAVFYGGERAVAAYAILSYMNFMTHVGDGYQPMISSAYGKGDVKGLQRIKWMSYCLSLLIALGGMGVIYALRRSIPVFFGASGEVCQLVAGAIPAFILSYLFSGYLKNSISIFYATQNNRMAYLLIGLEPVILLLCLSLFPMFMGLSGIWYSVPAAQATMALIAAVLSHQSEKALGRLSFE